MTLDVHADLFYSVLTTVADKLDEAVRKCGQRRPKALVRRPEKVTYLHRRTSKHSSLTLETPDRIELTTARLQGD